jgi:hypothetical protein
LTPKRNHVCFPIKGNNSKSFTNIILHVVCCALWSQCPYDGETVRSINSPKNVYHPQKKVTGKCNKITQLIIIIIIIISIEMTIRFGPYCPFRPATE